MSLTCASCASTVCSASGAYFCAASRTEASAASAPAIACCAGPFWLAQPTSITVISAASSHTNCFFIATPLVAVLTGISGNTQLLAHLDLVRILEHVPVGLKNLVVERSVAVVVLGDLRQAVARLHDVG